MKLDKTIEYEKNVEKVKKMIERCENTKLNECENYKISFEEVQAIKNVFEELQKSVDQIYDDYQDIGKMFFDLDEKVGVVKVICKQKYLHKETEAFSKTILDILEGK